MGNHYTAHKCIQWLCLHISTPPPLPSPGHHSTFSIYPTVHILSFISTRHPRPVTLLHTTSPLPRIHLYCTVTHNLFRPTPAVLLFLLLSPARLCTGQVESVRCVTDLLALQPTIRQSPN